MEWAGLNLYIFAMKKGDILKNCKLAVVLLINSMPIWFTIRAITADNVDSDFLGLGLIFIFLFFLIFNVWALIVYFLTKLIKRVWLREILFYLLLLSFLFSPLLIPGLFGRG